MTSVLMRYVVLAAAVLAASCLRLNNQWPEDAGPDTGTAPERAGTGGGTSGNGGAPGRADAATEDSPGASTSDVPVTPPPDSPGAKEDAGMIGCSAGQRMCGADCVTNEVPCNDVCATGWKLCGAKCVTNATCCASDMPGCGSACKRCQDGACVNADEGTSCGTNQICKAGTCGECGDLNKPCCGNACSATGTTCQAGTCEACGGAGQPCCGSACNDGYVCKNTTCERACGDGAGQTCCENATKSCKNKCGDEGVITCRGGKYGNCSKSNPECCPDQSQKCTNSCKIEGTRTCGGNGKWAQGCSSDSIPCGGGVNQPCRNGGCDPGLYCEGGTICRKKLPTGAVCQEGFNCESGICKDQPGVCNGKNGFLVECTDNTPCAPPDTCKTTKQCS
jgi:hypothetical protein